MPRLICSATRPASPDSRSQSLLRLDHHRGRKRNLGLQRGWRAGHRRRVGEAYGLALDAAGDLFIANTDNNCVRVVNQATGLITDLVGDGPFLILLRLHGHALFWPSGVAVDNAGNLFIADTDDNRIREITPLTLSLSVNSPSTVVGNFLFYNNSFYNGNNTTASAADDAAVATDKQPLLPGQTATDANYIDATQGINGIMVDVDDLAEPGRLSAADFQFRLGDDNNPADWTALTPRPAVTVRAGAGTGGSDRVELTWPDNTIHNQWLQVTVLADANTGLATPDVFYFGSEPGPSWPRVTLPSTTSSPCTGPSATRPTCP